MSGECEKCGEHCLDCNCEERLMTEPSPHHWIYKDREHRKCSKCLMEEILDDEENWIWLSTEDFMDSTAVCQEKDS